MKKLLLILLIVCSSSTAYYSWSGLSSNQTVSFNDALDAVNTGVFVAKTTITGSSKMMTKSEASTYLYIDESYSPFAAKSSGQLIVKSDLVGSLPYLTMQCIIASGKGIKVDGSLTRGGNFCTGVAPIGCSYAFDFDEGSGIVDDNNTLVTFNEGGPGWPSGVNTVRCFFTSKVTTSMTVTVTLYRNGVNVGSNSLNTSYVSGTNYTIDVAVSNIDLSTNPVSLKLVYS